MSKYYSDQHNCAHAWAHQHSPNGRASNLFFEGRVIYSYGYHFPIAFNNGDVIYFTLQGYSKSTGKQKSIVDSAISHKRSVYVQFVPTSREEVNSIGWQKKNINYWLDQIEALVAEREIYPQRISINGKIQRYINLLTTFNSAIPGNRSPELPTLATNTIFQKYQVSVREQEVKYAEKAQKRYQANIRLWQEGKISAFPIVRGSGIDQSLAYLRFNKESNRIETTKSIRIPVEIALRFWNYIQSVLPAGCTNCEYTIMDFSVTEISEEKLVVGCHTITMREIRRMVEQLGWQ